MNFLLSLVEFMMILFMALVHLVGVGCLLYCGWYLIDTIIKVNRNNS